MSGDEEKMQEAAWWTHFELAVDEVRHWEVVV
jgi:hypothetical protein